MNASDPLTAYYSTEYQRRNMQVANVCGAKASVDKALERALTVKSIPVWLIAHLESAANRLPGISADLAAWRDLAPDAPDHVRRATPDPLSDPRVKALVEAAQIDAIRAALEEAAAIAEDAESGRCQRCGHPRNNHPYRHPFIGSALGDLPAAIRAIDPAAIAAKLKGGDDAHL